MILWHYQVQTMLEERIGEQLKGELLTSVWAYVKDEIRLLWTEVDSLINNREDMAGQVEHLTFVTEKVKEHFSPEHEILKSGTCHLRKQFQSLMVNDV